MRRFVMLDGDGELAEEGVEMESREVFVFRPGCALTYTRLDEAWELLKLPGWSLRFLDFHTTDEAYHLAKADE